jgi:hypothetical protein
LAPWCRRTTPRNSVPLVDALFQAIEAHTERERKVDQPWVGITVQARVGEFRARLRLRFLELRPEVNEPDHDPWCHGLDDLFFPRSTWRTSDRCEGFRLEVERVGLDPLGRWPAAD